MSADHDYLDEWPLHQCDAYQVPHPVNMGRCGHPTPVQPVRPAAIARALKLQEQLDRNRPLISHWLDEDPTEHPLIAELRQRPGVWAVLDRYANEFRVAREACCAHPNVEFKGGLVGMDTIVPYRARWLPDPIVAAMQILERGGWRQDA